MYYFKGEIILGLSGQYFPHKAIVESTFLCSIAESSFCVWN